mmetsp:Transcript_6093/g.9265  ORF Transcript_6093/g.9265 Transcript_6093/m.9265 type:complete len:95 (+) Transcript_6093:1232-1516(+)
MKYMIHRQTKKEDPDNPQGFPLGKQDEYIVYKSKSEIVDRYCSRRSLFVVITSDISAFLPYGDLYCLELHLEEFSHSYNCCNFFHFDNNKPSKS